MTLNITVLSADSIYQSAYFRLSRDGIPDPEPSTKRIIVANPSWTGFLTYTGVGRVGTEHTGSIVRNWLSGSSERSFAETVELVRGEGSKWLATLGSPRHTFVLAGYVGNSPRAAIISNYQQWHGHLDPLVADELRVSIIVASKRPEIVVTGVHDSVLRGERHALRRLVEQHPQDSLRIRQAMATLQKVAARRRPTLISEDCIVYSQTRDGRGHETPFGNTPVRDLGLLGGHDMTESIRTLLDEQFGAGQWTMRQAASARSGPVDAPPPDCELRTVHDDSEFEVVLLAEAPGRRATPRSVNSEGTIVGEAAGNWRGPEHPCIWLSPTEVQPLINLGGFGGQALAINASSSIAGYSETPDRSSHACSWDAHGNLTDLHPQGHRSSGLKALNDKGVAVGWVTVHPTEHGQAHYRPTVWRPDRDPLILEDMQGGWGEAIDVDDDVRVGGFVYHGGTCSAWIWASDRLEILGMPEAPARSIIPAVLTSDGGMVGTQVNKDGSRHVARWVPDNGWVTHLPPNSDPGAFARAGDVAGRTLSDGLYIPWFRTATALIELPHFRHHHHQVTSIGANGWLLGNASADNCSHPIVWREQRT